MIIAAALNEQTPPKNINKRKERNLVITMHAKDPKEYLSILEKEKERLEKEMEALIEKRNKGEISEEEFNEAKKRIERKFIEVMDRIVQLRYITGESKLFS